LHCGLRNLLAYLCPSLDFIKSCVVSFDFGLVSFAPRKVLVAPDYLGDLLLREPITFDSSRIVRRKCASTRGVMGNVKISCLTASIRIRPLAMAGVMEKAGLNRVRFGFMANVDSGAAGLCR